jgi:pimeloyl-ACP methyl ester carboxylesterase
VRPAGAHPYFAVMVAGSGPTDRNWSSPLMAPSHGGRDFAEWLQKQGVGSLRYDKRFIGSKDPKLDISLDAQVGDIKAAIAAARAFPEAEGKKILLVGHSEGAMLGVMAAGDADSLLLIGLPAKPMSQLILDQLGAQLAAAQLPEGIAAANRTYLTDALDSLRKNTPLPVASDKVFPNLVRLVESLRRPESVDFVRSTLDLDPWPVAARSPVPLAAVYGDKDAQTPKPEPLPSGFKGTVIDILNANHLLKQETRPRAELTGANAGSAYGDATPQADLSPVANWLKGLK